MLRFLLVAAALLFSCLPVRAHDYWLLPDTFFPAAGDSLAVRLFVGDDFVPEAERPFQKKATVRFQQLFGGKTTDLVPLGTEEKTPLLSLPVCDAGTHLFAMERIPRLITLEADKFNKYLAEEGLDSILAERKKAGEERKPGRERYSRCLKSLIQVGATRDETAVRVLGQKLEIMPGANPYALKIGDELSVRILFDGKPLAGVKVFAHRRDSDKVTTKSVAASAEGRATFRLDGGGAWLIRLVHMRRVADAEADWESYWAALTFGVK